MKSGFSCVCVCACVRLEPSLDQSTTSVIQTPWQPLMCGVASCAFNTHICTATPPLQERVWNMFNWASVLSYVCSDVCHDVYLWHFSMCICTCLQVCVQMCVWVAGDYPWLCVCWVCLCDRLTCAQMADDEHMNFTSHFTCWHDNSYLKHIWEEWN